MNNVFHRNPLNHYPVAAQGDGIYIIDSKGKRYLDGSSGAAVSCLGHSETAVIDAIKAQLDTLPFAHTSFFTNKPMEQLAAELIEVAPEGIERIYFVSGGSEAIEAALKLARQYFVEKGEPQRTRVIARQQSYHGNTLGALAAGGNLWRRRQFEPLLFDVTHVPTCYPYRNRREGETEDAYGERLAKELEAEIQRLGPDTVMAFLAETVAGATIGAIPPVPGYFRRVREICDRHGVLLILDEVMCGMGRTGSLFASEQEGIAPDMVCIGKGLGAGYQPIGAMLATGRIHDTVTGGSGFFQHGHTYTGHATACAAGLAVQRIFKERNLVARVKEMGIVLERRLRERLGEHPHVGDIRGRGLFWGVELVADPETKAPFDPAHKVNGRLKLKALENGLMCYPMGGTIDGVRGDHVMLMPPFIITEAQIDEAVDKLARSIDQVLSN